MLEDFTQDEALSKVGKTVQTRTPFFGLPQGTKGAVVWADFQPQVTFETRQIQTVWHVVIEWQRWERPGYIPVPSFRDWLTKALDEKFLIEKS